MTRGSILEYVEAIRGRYLSVSKKEKETVLSCEVTFRYIVGCMALAAGRVIAHSENRFIIGSPPHAWPEGVTLSEPFSQLLRKAPSPCVLHSNNPGARLWLYFPLV